MVPSKTYLKFKETRSQEDLNTLNKYLKRLSEISSKLNNDALELSDEEENKLYDEDEDLTDKVLRLLFGDTFFIFISEYSLDGYHSLEDNQDKAYQDLINQVNATYGDGGVLQFKNIKGIKNYFDSVTIETQELIPIGFKNTLLNRETK